MAGFLSRFRGDRRGVSAVEFALIAPAIIAFYFGLAEVTQATMAERRAKHAAAAVGDLVAQFSQITDANITDIFKIADTIIEPFPKTPLKLRVTSVTATAAGVPKVDWSSGKGMTALTAGTTVTLPTGVIAANQSLIMTEVSYAYTSPADRFIPAAITFSQKYYLRPRKSDKVTKT